jgi:hypothetical protein
VVWGGWEKHHTGPEDGRDSSRCKRKIPRPTGEGAGLRDDAPVFSAESNANTESQNPHPTKTTEGGAPVKEKFVELGGIHKRHHVFGITAACGRFRRKHFVDAPQIFRSQLYV